LPAWATSDTVGCMLDAGTMIERSSAFARGLLWVLTLVCGCAHEKAPDTRRDTPNQAPTTTTAASGIPMTNENAALSAAEAWLS
jgi:hypothetical protein